MPNAIIDFCVNPRVDVKRVGGLVVIILTAMLVGGWMYVDAIKGNVEVELHELRARILTEKSDGWRTFVSPDDAFQVDLPPGMRLSEGRDAAYVVREGGDGAMPVAIIQITEPGDRDEYEKVGGRLYEGHGRLYWFYPWQHEPWGPFARSADSFTILD